MRNALVILSHHIITIINVTVCACALCWLVYLNFNLKIFISILFISRQHASLHSRFHLNFLKLKKKNFIYISVRHIVYDNVCIYYYCTIFYCKMKLSFSFIMSNKLIIELQRFLMIHIGSARYVVKFSSHYILTHLLKISLVS